MLKETHTPHLLVAPTDPRIRFFKSGLKQKGIDLFIHLFIERIFNIQDAALFVTMM